MKIVKVGVFPYQLKFRKPFKITYETVSVADIVLFRIETERGFVGYGSAAPDEKVTSESIARVLEACILIQPEFFVRGLQSIEDIYYYRDVLRKKFSELPSLRAAIEMALFDVLGKERQVSIKKLLQSLEAGCGPRIPHKDTMITIGIQDRASTLREVKARLKEGYRMIKLKCGLDLKEDLEKIKSVRALIPKNRKLALDANQGYSFLEARFLIDKLNALNIEFFEQPVHADDHKALARLSAMGSIPIFADEAAVSTEGAITLLKKNYVDGVNIKLMKCGGFFDFLEIHRIARKTGKKIMIGCMYESHLSLVAGAHLAFALDLDYIDLDSGHLDFTNDPFAGGMTMRQGILILSERAYGLGVKPYHYPIFL